MGFPGSSHGKKNLPAMQGDPGSTPRPGRSLEMGVATHSSILAWRIPMDRGAWQAVQSIGSHSQTTEGLTLSLPYSRTFLFICFVYGSLNLLILES